VQVFRAVLLEIANDKALSTGTKGTKLCLSYTKLLIKQFTKPTTENMEFGDLLIKCLNSTIVKGEDREKCGHDSLHCDLQVNFA